MPFVESVNTAQPQANPYKRAPSTGIGKRPQAGPVQVRDPGPKTTGLGSGLVGDFVGDGKHHGGAGQAVYAYAREDLDAWQERLGRQLPNGFFGENLTTVGLDITEARIGERWRIGETVELQVTYPRIPCATFRGWVGERGWLKTFTQAAIPGAYLKVVTPGPIQGGDAVLVHRPAHEVTVALMFRALTLEPGLLPRMLEAGEELPDGI